MYICICNGIRHSEIVEAVTENGCHTLDHLRVELGVASCCGKCADDAEQVIDHAVTRSGAERAAAPTVHVWPALAADAPGL